MKRVSLLLAGMFVAAGVFAQTAGTDNSINAGQDSTAVGALATFNSSVGGGNINSNNVTNSTNNGGVSQAQNVYQSNGRQVVMSNQPVMLAPLTTSGMDTCLGSITGGVSIPGIGVSGGKTTVDENCVMLKNSKRMQELGLNDAALMLLVLSNDKIKDALITTNPEIFQALTSKADKSAEVRAAARQAKAQEEPKKGFFSWGSAEQQ